MNTNKRFFAFAALMALSCASFTRCSEVFIERANTIATVGFGAVIVVAFVGAIYEDIINPVSDKTAANAYHQATPAIVTLQNDIREIAKTKSAEEKAQVVTVLRNLVALLESPKDLHALGASPDVLRNTSTRNFVSKIQLIAESNFYKPRDGRVQKRFCGSRLSQEGFIFYDIIKQKVVHMFNDLLPEYRDNSKGAMSLSIAR